MRRIKPSSSDSEHKVRSELFRGRFEARLADGGWVVFDAHLGKTFVDAAGRRYEYLSEKEAVAKADELNPRERVSE